MELAYKDEIAHIEVGVFHVSILVLMELAYKVIIAQDVADSIDRVSILVLMELAYKDNRL